MGPTRKDEEGLLRMRLGRGTEPDAMDERLRADIMEIIAKVIPRAHARVARFPISNRNNVTHG